MKRSPTRQHLPQQAIRQPEGVPIWERLYIGRIVACVLILASIVYFLAHGIGAFAVGHSVRTDMAEEDASASQSVDVTDGTGMPMGESLVPNSTTGISGDWDRELDVTEWAYAKPLRVAHQKNSAERVAAASDFDAIEVDLRGATDDGNDCRLLHDDYHGYTLRQFLHDCQRQNQIAVLDVKYDADVRSAVDIVTEEGMLAQTVFQVASGRVAKEICDRNGQALCWLLNGAGEESGLREDELRQYADCLVGVNICGSVVGSDRAESVISAAHAIAGRDGTPLDICIFAYGQRTDVYGNDDLYARLGVDALMTDVCPERSQRAIMEID